jgi:hypothetical protein
MQASAQILIHRPPPAVFPWIVDPQKARQWQPEVTGYQVLIDKPDVVGTTFTETIEEDGNTLKMYGVITAHLPNELMRFHLESRIHSLDITYSLVAQEVDTLLRIETAIQWKFPMNLISFFAGRKMRDTLQDRLAREGQQLKQLCEA